MPQITKSNAKYHCLTCLHKLYDENENQAVDKTNVIVNSNWDTDEDYLLSELQGVCVTKDVLQLLAKCVEPNILEQITDLPAKLCINCHVQLKNFECFCRRARCAYKRLQSLQTLQDENELLSFDITELVNLTNENNDNHTGIEVATAEVAAAIEDDCALLKNELQETETVLLENTTHLISDPFGNLPIETSHETTTDLSQQKKNEFFEDSLPANTNANTCDNNSNNTHEVLAEDKLNANTKQRKSKRCSKKESNADVLLDKAKTKRRIRGTKNSFKCAQCRHSFAHKITMEAHVRKVHEGNKRPFKCDRCEKTYTFIGGLYTHIKEIHDAEVRSYTCDYPGCERNYTSIIAMQKHKRLKHSDKLPEKKYICEQCGATFNQSGNLKYHLRVKHPTDAETAAKANEQRFYCEICNRQFHSRYTLKYHTLQLHSNDAMKYSCDICGRRMAKKFMLLQHMLVHSKDKLPCEHCGKQFIRKFELEAHIRAVHMKIKPFECKYCAECFASRKTLRHHEYIHTGEKPYVCAICGQAYRQQTCLKNHRKIHEKIDNNDATKNNVNEYTAVQS